MVYGHILWTFVCAGVSVCFCTLTSLWAEGQSVVESYLASWHEATFPFSPPYKCPSGWCPLQLQLLKAALRHTVFHADFIDVLESIQARKASMTLRVGAIRTTMTTNVKNVLFIWSMCPETSNQSMLMLDWHCEVTFIIQTQRQLNPHQVTTSLQPGES